MKEVIDSHIMSEFKKAKDICPTLHSFRWTQYAPYFNDGDPCVFSVNPDVEANFGEDVDVDDECDREYSSSYSYDSGTKEHQAIEMLSEAIANIPEDVLESKYGENNQVTVSETDIVSDDYEHD